MHVISIPQLRAAKKGIRPPNERMPYVFFYKNSFLLPACAQRPPREPFSHILSRCQMSLLYSSMVLSLENLPLEATFRTDMRYQEALSA